MSQPKLPPIDHVQKNFFFLMAQINRQWRRIIDRKLQPLGITEAMWLPLLHLVRATEPMRQKDLAASLSLDSSSVVRLIDMLESGKLVERFEGADRRAKNVHLTALGRSTAQHVEELVSEGRDCVLASVSERELVDAFHVLERIADTLSSVEQNELK